MLSTWYVPKTRDKAVLLLKAYAGCKGKSFKILVRIMPGDMRPKLGTCRWYSKRGKWTGRRRALEVGAQFLAHYGLIHNFIDWNQ